METIRGAHAVLPFIVPIRGTTNTAHLDENIRAAAVTFDPHKLRELDAAVAASILEAPGFRLRFLHYPEWKPR